MIKKQLRSFAYAVKGCKYLLEERNFILHIVSAILVIALGFICDLQRTDWILVSICIGMVLAAEAFNTALEELCDHMHPDQHNAISRVKDMSAAAVLIISAAAAIVGLVVFIPYLK